MGSHLPALPGHLGSHRPRRRPPPNPIPWWGRRPPKVPLQPLVPSINPNVWSNPVLIGKLQLLSKTRAFLKTGKAYQPSELVIYYHSDQEKAILNRLGKPDRVGEASPSSARGVIPEVRYYMTIYHGLIIPLKIWLVRTTGTETIDPILTHPELPDDLTESLKISLSPDNNAIELTPLDYSTAKFYTSILWLLVNRPSFLLASPELSPPTYAPSPPGSPSGGFSPPVEFTVLS